MGAVLDGHCGESYSIMFHVLESSFRSKAVALHLEIFPCAEQQEESMWGIPRDVANEALLSKL